MTEEGLWLMEFVSFNNTLQIDVPRIFIHHLNSSNRFNKPCLLHFVNLFSMLFECICIDLTIVEKVYVVRSFDEYNLLKLGVVKEEGVWVSKTSFDATKVSLYIQVDNLLTNL